MKNVRLSRRLVHWQSLATKPVFQILGVALGQKSAQSEPLYAVVLQEARRHYQAVQSVVHLGLLDPILVFEGRSLLSCSFEHCCWTSGNLHPHIAIVDMSLRASIASAYCTYLGTYVFMLVWSRMPRRVPNDALRSIPPHSTVLFRQGGSSSAHFSTMYCVAHQAVDRCVAVPLSNGIFGA